MREALHDVTLTLLGTIALVVLVIFLFLRRFVATVIPTLSLPVSLIGAVALLWGLNYSLDNISLLGLTLAVGLVVDDAIVMLENIMRHVENGEPPFQAALRGSREVGFTIITISSSLVAVFIPIFFMPGVIGLLFHEFAVVVGLAIVVSAFVSLTLVPMLASRFLKADDAHKKPTGRARSHFRARLQRHAARATRARWTWPSPSGDVLVVALLTFIATAWLFYRHSERLFPRRGHRPDPVSTEAAEDTIVSRDGAAAGTRRGDDACRSECRQRQLVQRRRRGAEHRPHVRKLKPQTERLPMKQVVEGLRRKLRDVAGINVFMRPIQNLQLGGRQSKAQFQYILQSVRADEINEWANKLQERLRADPLFRDVTSDASYAVCKRS